MYIYLILYLILYFLSPQPAVRPPTQKAKSPAPQAPGGSSAPKLGSKGAFQSVGLWMCMYMPTCPHARTKCARKSVCYTTRQSFTSFSLNYPCSPAASGFTVAKATSFFACSAALQTDEGRLWTFFFFFCFLFLLL